MNTGLSIVAFSDAVGMCNSLDPENGSDVRWRPDTYSLSRAPRMVNYGLVSHQRMKTDQKTAAKLRNVPINLTSKPSRCYELNLHEG